MSKPKVYIAGPITKGNSFHNVSAACAVWKALWIFGLHPICPHWSAIQDMIAPVSYEAYMQYDFDTIAECDAVLRMPGESAGADRELAFARERDIPVFHSVGDVLHWAQDRLAEPREVVTADVAVS